MKPVFLLLALLFPGIQAKEPDLVAINIPYYDNPASEVQKEVCRLDVHRPANANNTPVLVWFHGGGLTGGKRGFPPVKDQGITLVAASYRFAPPENFPCFLEDAAAATAWTFGHVAGHGGDPKKIFVGGHSAGGYLALIVGSDPKWLAPHGISNKSIAGLIPVSAQVTTHFHVKKLRGDTGEQLRPLIDEFAPLYHSSNNLPPICLITGDRKIEYKSRVEENDLYAITLKNLGHPAVEFHELPGLDHGTVMKGTPPVITAFIRKNLIPETQETIQK